MPNWLEIEFVVKEKMRQQMTTKSQDAAIWDPLQYMYNLGMNHNLLGITRMPELGRLSGTATESIMAFRKRQKVFYDCTKTGIFLANQYYRKL